MRFNFLFAEMKIVRKSTILNLAQSWHRIIITAYSFPVVSDTKTQGLNKKIYVTASQTICIKSYIILLKISVRAFAHTLLLLLPLLPSLFSGTFFFFFSFWCFFGCASLVGIRISKSAWLPSVDHRHHYSSSPPVYMPSAFIR